MVQRCSRFVEPEERIEAGGAGGVGGGVSSLPSLRPPFLPSVLPSSVVPILPDAAASSTAAGGGGAAAAAAVAQAQAQAVWQQLGGAGEGMGGAGGGIGGGVGGSHLHHLLPAPHRHQTVSVTEMTCGGLKFLGSAGWTTDLQRLRSAGWSEQGVGAQAADMGEGRPAFRSVEVGDDLLVPESGKTARLCQKNYLPKTA